MPAKTSRSEPQSPSKKQKKEHDHDLREPHEMTADSTETTGEDQKDPYPNGTDHESKGKHDTTTTHADEEAEKQKEGSEWRDQPPYRTESHNDHATKHHEAECNCGRIKYWLSREKPLASKYCHCTDCQSLHGAPFQWAAIFKKEDLHFENGAKGLAFYHAQKKHTYHDLPCKVSCAYCHAPIMDEGRNMVLMFPAIIKFKSEQAQKDFQPT
ncbi:hypothetical protein PG984_013223 [Apiospora sp. TS-2023a]|uniref:CENP-V/GFA domain-containing protein n=1 Tax=Apiospora saccharicola TaxID=335842 RepID=A0ABR1V042_9PEZI